MAWKPRPGDRNADRRKPYHAGYSDGFHRYRFGSGDDEPGDDYRQGFDDGRTDLKADDVAVDRPEVVDA